MNPKKQDEDGTDGVIAFEPFSEPHTIPSGWDVSALDVRGEEEALPILLPVEEFKDVAQASV